MVRVRFAPSPTGELHLGGARTALYNYLFAKKSGGAFIIRIEDTDRERHVEGSLDRILENLRWLGLTWEEGPDVGGAYGPYVQSQRLEHYVKYAQELLDKGLAYPCFCSEQRLDVLRQVQDSEHQPTRYDRTCLRLSPADVKAKLEAKEPHVIRLKVPEGTTTVRDLIRGDIEVKNDSLDDQVLLKSDGFPTYHLANVVDDRLMEITHVIRGEEWLPSTPKHVLLYQAFGWQAPVFAHLPNVLNEKRAKLSKRKDGEIVWLDTYRKLGYLPEAVANFLGLLGWHPKDDKEMFSLPELAQAFELERVQKAGAIFSLMKLDWFNGEYVRKLDDAALNGLLKPYYRELAQTLGRDVQDTLALTQVLKTRLTSLSSVKAHAAWFFAENMSYEPSLLVPKKGDKEKSLKVLEEACEVFEEVAPWTREKLEGALMVLVRPGTFTRGDVFWPTRVALTGLAESPDAPSSALALGQTESVRRLQHARKLLSA